MADQRKKGTPRKGTHRSSAPSPARGGRGMSMPRGGASLGRGPAGPSGKPRLSAKKPSAPARKPSLAVKRTPAPKAAARPMARPAGAHPSAAHPRQGAKPRKPIASQHPNRRSAARKPASGSPKLELKNPFVGIGAKKPSSKPAAGGAQGSAPGFLNRGGAPISSGAAAREQHQKEGRIKLVGGVAVLICVLGLAALVAFFALRDSALFSADNVIIEPSTHVSDADISNLLTVPDGTTLLNVDLANLESQIKRDPWVESLELTREFPHTLRLTIKEQELEAFVVMSSGSLGWYLGSGGSWIEPAKIAVADGQSINDAALQKARSEGVLLITGVPATVDPQAGCAATDDVLAAVDDFRNGFSSGFSSMIVSYDASSADAISCILENGVQISLGSATNISAKEQVAQALLDKYPGQITYINVRNPSSASVRRVGSEDVTQGSGADGQAAGAGGQSSASSADSYSSEG